MPHESLRKFHNFLQHGTLLLEKSPFPCFSPYTAEFQALVPGSTEMHLLCHVTLLYCQADPNPKPNAKSKAKESLLPLPILPLMWQPLAHLNQCFSSNPLLFMQVSSRVGWASLCTRYRTRGGTMLQVVAGLLRVSTVVG